MDKKILVSGIKPTGRLHFGNYFGAMKQNIELGNSDEFDAYIFMADYHALNTVQDNEELIRSTYEVAAGYIACGLDTSKVTFFRQSSVPQHTELCWIFNNVVTMPYLTRAHAFKSQVDSQKSSALYQTVEQAAQELKKYDLSHEERVDVALRPIVTHLMQNVNVGLLDYPVLMAADILMYQADIVPVGSDQKQHIEYARDIAGFYNRAWNVERFKLPKDYILESVATIPGVDGQKMSKSKGNVIPLFGTDEELKKIVMSIVTDSALPTDKKDPDTNTLYLIHKLFLSEEDDKKLRAKFEEGGYGYKEAKEELLATIMKWREGKKEIFDDLMSNPEKIKSILAEGGEKARARAAETMSQVRKDVGFE